MLARLEDSMLALVKASPLARHLRQVDTLPDLSDDALIGRFVTDAPAVYAALGSFPVNGGNAQFKAGFACVAKNSRGQREARHGDGRTVGLYQMLGVLLPLLEDASFAYGEAEGDSLLFEVTSCDFLTSEALFQKGVYVAVIQIRSVAEMPLNMGLDTDSLADFKTFSSDYDLPPFESKEEHDKWLQEPPDHSASRPELSDTLHLQE